MKDSYHKGRENNSVRGTQTESLIRGQAQNSEIFFLKVLPRLCFCTFIIDIAPNKVRPLLSTSGHNWKIPSSNTSAISSRRSLKVTPHRMNFSHLTKPPNKDTSYGFSIFGVSAFMSTGFWPGDKEGQLVDREQRNRRTNEQRS